ncbi:MAG: hypothetical protein ACR2JJ_06330 [Sphingomicrobium sp.]
MLDRALNGTEKIVVRKDGSEERMREYPNQIAMHLLKMHRESAVEANLELDETGIEEVRERLFAKLQRLRKRIETKTRATGNESVAGRIDAVARKSRAGGPTPDHLQHDVGGPPFARL